ncbi:Golgi-associated plant pathogenesis-related protein 1 [Aphelenchoides besseyi]|nr:Golgi-associated plant pathogenesis-related protein 1 [Aphelenchoides besseyi]KAI6199853.1 Golgi-associated plant pathogenesis-related protein 1 [Aphelenchoides besseyi]
MIKRLFGRKLRKSHSVGEEQHNATNQAGTSNGASHLAVSKTFHGSKNYRSDECRSFMDATSSSGAENARVDPELDRALMQTITDVKYVKRRPKFTAVVDANFQRQCLEAHNLVREKYGSPALIWSQELADLAKSWATNLAERGRVLYPELPGIGENIHLVVEGRDDHLTTGSEIVALWASEADQFDFANPRWNLKAKNFTQMLWRSSVELGVARFWNTSKNCLAIVAFYRPAGNSNIPREFANNLPLQSSISHDARAGTQLQSLLEQMNHCDLSAVTFRSDPPKSHS